MANKKKQPTKIKVVGCGGIGLCLLPVLCRYLNYAYEEFPYVEVSLIDGDEYEERNRERQDFIELGPKASMTAAEYREKFPRLIFWDHPVYVGSHNVANLIKEGDIVFLCVDNHKTRKLISDRAMRLENVVVISGGNDYTDGNVLVHVRQKGKNITPQLASKYHPEIVNPKDKNPADIKKEDKLPGCQQIVEVEPQLLFANNLVAAAMLSKFYGVSQGAHLKKPEDHAEIYVDVPSCKVVPRPRFV